MKILNTTKISYEIEKILEETETFLILVSPYLKLNQRLKVKLSDAFKKTKSVYFIFRENEISPTETTWLDSFQNVNVFSLKNLHSKIYMNEKSALVTSMNLYEFSQINNHEIGVKFDLDNEMLEFKSILNEIRIMLDTEYNQNGLDKIVDYFENYTMGGLFWELNEKFTFKNFEKGSQKLFEFFCNIARELVEFTDDELYLDKTAILRATDLGKVRYSLIKTKLLEIKN